jgi:hypothetical protein
MVKLIALLSLIIALPTFAIDAVVTVLETPLFENPDEYSKILQYVRKGDIISLHPSVKKIDRYHNLGPDGTSDKELYGQSYKEYQRQFPDPLFKNEMYNYQEGDEYIMTLTKRKRVAYIKRNHLHIYYETPKELSQKKLSYDPTDYRIHEPLPNDYPFIKPHGKRGFITLGTGTFNRSLFPAPGEIKNQNSGTRSDLTLAWSDHIDFDLTQRLYFGALLNYTGMNRRVLFIDRELKENITQLGIGPYISYDAFRTDESLWSVNLSFTANIINKITITQQNSSGSEEQIYSNFNFTARTGIVYQRKKVFQDFLDFVVVGSLNFEPPTEYTTTLNQNNNSDWWKEASFTRKFLAEFTLSLGFQSAY